MLLKIVDILDPQPIFGVFHQKAVDKVFELLTSLRTDFFMFVLFVFYLVEEISALDKLFWERIFLVNQGIDQHTQRPEVYGSGVLGTMQFFGTEVGDSADNLLKIVSVFRLHQPEVCNERVTLFVDENVL